MNGRWVTDEHYMDLYTKIDELQTVNAKLLKMLQIAEAHLGWGDCSLANVHSMAREAIAEAKEVTK